MLDLFGILLSSIVIVLVVLRAIQLDSTTPWFGSRKTNIDDSGLRLRPEPLTPRITPVGGDWRTRGKQ